MSQTIDATGKACPIPFMLAKEQIDANQQSFTVLVDNKAAVENLKRLAKTQGFATTVEMQGNAHNVLFTRDMREKADDADSKDIDPSLLVCEPDVPSNGSYLVFFGKDTMGDGEFELGRNLARMFLYTLEKGEKLPATIVLMNSGIKLAVEDDQCITTLRALVEKGVELIVCGTCLNYYNLLDDLKVGTVGNMYDITQRFLQAEKIITL